MAQETLEKFEGEKENNFKQTEIGSISEDWEVVRLGEVAEVKAGQSAPQGEKYFQNGKYPFIRVQHIDNNDYKIMGWDLINDMAVKDYHLKLFSKGTIVFPKSGAAVYLEKRAMLPFDAYIVSHLCAVNSKSEKLLQRFLFYFLVSQKLAKKKAEGYPTLNLSEVKEILIPLLPLSEQRKIARVLDKIQQAIELQDRIIEQAKNLKKSLMQKLFTEGLYGEEQKEMEIGLIPKSWKVVRLGDIVTKTRQRDPKRMPYLKFKYVDVSSISNELYKIIEFREFLGKNAPSRARKEIKTGDIIFATVRPYLKRIAIVPQELDGELCSTAFCVLRCNKNFADHVFVFNYLLTDNFVERVSASQRGSSYPAVTDKDVLNQKIPLPSFEEQKQIAHILSVVDRKIEVEQKRKQVLKELFKTMLHKLMSGEIRLKEVEI